MQRHALLITRVLLFVMAEGLPERILETVASSGQVDSYQYACSLNIDHQHVVGAIKSLESLGEVSKQW